MSYLDILREEFKFFFYKWLKLDDKLARLELDKIALKIKEARNEWRFRIYSKCN